MKKGIVATPVFASAVPAAMKELKAPASVIPSWRT